MEERTVRWRIGRKREKSKQQQLEIKLNVMENICSSWSCTFHVFAEQQKSKKEMARTYMCTYVSSM
jgi:Fe-S cluster assembly iron-binding protein IscA